MGVGRVCNIFITYVPEGRGGARGEGRVEGKGRARGGEGEGISINNNFFFHFKVLGADRISQ